MKGLVDFFFVLAQLRLNPSLVVARLSGHPEEERHHGHGAEPGCTGPGEPGDGPPELGPHPLLW